MARTALSLVLLAAPAFSQQVWTVPATWSTQSSFASALAVTGDHDQDGFPDLIVGSRYAPGGGVVQIRSGLTGALIRQIQGTFPFEVLGVIVSHVDDADGDGAPDLIVWNQGGAKLFSGATGTPLRTYTNTRGGGGVGDLNGDGRGDYAVCESAATRMYSGIDGGVLLTIPVAYGNSVVSVGDVSGDGVADLALTHIVDPGFPQEVNGRMSVFSGATGAELHGVDTAGGGLLGNVITVADRDGDGRRDLAFAHPDELPQQLGRIAVHSSATGALIRTIANPEPVGTVSFRSDFGGMLAEVPDIDLDGVPEIAAGSNRPRGLWVLSGASGVLLMAVQTPNLAPDYFVGVAGLPDIDGDGRGELVYGDPSDQNGPTSLGSLTVVRGTSDGSHGSRSCFGDGSGTACPCGNFGGAGQGCANTTGSGSTLHAYGSTSMSEHDLWFLARGLPGGASGSTYLFFGTSTAGGGAGVANFAGLRCAGGSLRRVGQHDWKGGGVASWVPNLIDPFYISAGGTYHFQSMYRDVTSPCATANFTNLVSLTFAP